MGRWSRLYAAFEEAVAPGMHLRRKIRRAPRAELGSVGESTLARLTGLVRPFEKRLLEAPLSGRPCVYYALRVISVYGGGQRGSHTEIGTEHEGIPFLLEDDTAHAVIDPDHARISVAFDFQSESKAAFDADPRQRALLDRLGLIGRNWFSTGTVLYREGILETDERITVVGAGVGEPDPDAVPTGMYRDGRPMRLRFTGTARFPLVISDDPRSL